MTKSKTKISKQTKRKSNPEIVETISLAKKNEKWIEVAEILSSPTRKKFVINLDQISDGAEDQDIIVVPGKVLSLGEINKKIKISAVGFSENAMQKLKESKIEFNYIKDEIKSNPGAEKIKILRTMKWK